MAYKQHYVNDYHSFFKRAFQELHNGKELVDNWHYLFIASLLQREVERINRGEPRKKHIIINICPRAGKSLITSIIYPAWAWLTNPGLKFITASYSSTLSTNHARMTRNLITGEWYTAFSDVNLQPDQNQKGFFEVVGGGSKFATSVGGSLLGSGADIIILDDLMKVSDAMSTTERENVNNFFDETVITRLDDPDVGVFIIIAQRLHEVDIVGHLMEENPENYEHYNIPAEISPTVHKDLTKYYTDGFFFPERFGPKTLLNLKKSVGTYAYSAQFDQDPVPAGGGMVKEDWIKIIDHTDPNYKDIIRQPVNYAVDSAYTMKESNDPSAILAYHFYKNVVYVKDVLVGHYEFPDLLKKLVNFVYATGYTSRSRIYVEPKASGKSLVQTIRTTTKLNIQESASPISDKVSRLNLVLPMIESGRLVLLKGAWNTPYIQEITTFPKGKHDDQVDVTVIALNKLGMGTYNVR